jgi:hypothetical protein
MSAVKSKTLSCQPDNKIRERVDRLAERTGLKPASILQLCVRGYLPVLEQGKIFSDVHQFQAVPDKELTE